MSSIYLTAQWRMFQFLAKMFKQKQDLIMFCRIFISGNPWIDLNMKSVNLIGGGQHLLDYFNF